MRAWQRCINIDACKVIAYFNVNTAETDRRWTRVFSLLSHLLFTCDTASDPFLHLLKTSILLEVSFSFLVIFRVLNLYIEKRMEGKVGLKTVECLRGRLLAERRASRAANQDAEHLRQKVWYLRFLSAFCF